METMCREILVDTSGFLMGLIMAQCYGIILRFQGKGTWSSVEHPGSADLSRTMRSEASEIIGSVEQGDGDAKSRWCQSKSLMGKREVNRKALA